MTQLPVIDVHGMTSQEAKKTVMINLRAFYNQGFNEVTIVHGHGEGILKNMVRKLLGNIGYVKETKSANNDGATVAHFN